MSATVVNYLNQGYVQNAVGVSVNYTASNNDVDYQFQTTGEFTELASGRFNSD